jgi:hypothetical protein
MRLPPIASVFSSHQQPSGQSWLTIRSLYDRQDHKFAGTPIAEHFAASESSRWPK